MHLTRLGVKHARQVHLIGDGASWIWERIPALLRQLGCAAEILSEALDFCHATGKLNDLAQLAFSTQPQAQAWFKAQRRLLKQGRIANVLGHIQPLLAQAPAAARQEMQRLYDYLVRHQPRMAYQELVTAGLPSGSGAVESLIRQVVNLRLKSVGKFWLESAAEGVLLARCWWAAGQWSQFRQLVLTAGLLPLSSN